MNTENENKFIKFFSGKRFYALLAVCLIAVGVAGWSALDALNNISNENSDSYSDPTPSYNEPITSVPEEIEKPAQNEVSEVPYEEPVDTTPKRPVAETFIMPVENGTILKGFSETALQFSATYSDIRIHLGTDIKAAADSPVLACGDGVVEKIYEDELLGRVVIIDHGNGILVKYAGLSDKLAVKQDYIVKSGDKIGTLSGVPSECGDEMHLHIEVTKNGKSVDPIKQLKIAD